MPVRRGERRIGFSTPPPMAAEEAIRVHEILVNAIRTKDMVGIIKTYISVLSTYEIPVHSLEVEDPDEKAKIVEDLADKVAKSGPFYAPLYNSSLVIRRIARRIRRGDPILSKAPLHRIVKCIQDVFEKFFDSSLERVVEPCEEMGYDKIALHVGGQLPINCAARIVENSRSPRVAVFGRTARRMAATISKILGVGVTIAPPLYAYQLVRQVDLILFQPETITPDTMLARTGIAPLFEYVDAPGDLEVVGLTFSLAYTRQRGVIATGYRQIPVAPFRLEWQEILDVPAYDIIHIPSMKVNPRILDERGPSELNMSILGRKVLGLIKEMESLVEGRCRVYEVE